ncbi:MAG: V-type ATP synthase subunit A, partial [Spirochaetae bacterium HGW-Spirochaetae-7]
MNERILGQVKRVNGPVIEAKGITDARMLELVSVGESRLTGEVIKLSGKSAVIQVYEDTTGLAPNDNIYGSGMPLSLELGPGLIGTIYDGIQRPLSRLLELSGRFIERGVFAESLDRERVWSFVPRLKAGAQVSGGAILGTVQETSTIEHRICVPPDVSGKLVSIAPAGDYKVDGEIAVVATAAGERKLTMVQRWPIRVPRPVVQRRPLDIPLITGQRVIDTLFPLAKGGTVAIPGGFGTGKTMTQHAIAKWCDADIIVYIGCGERGNEMTDVLTEFPK